MLQCVAAAAAAEDEDRQGYVRLTDEPVVMSAAKGSVFF